MTALFGCEDEPILKLPFTCRSFFRRYNWADNRLLWRTPNAKETMTRGTRTRIWLSCGALMLALAAGPNAGLADESDHEQARQALQAGKVLPLRSVLDIVERDYPGQVVKVEFEEDDGEFIYEIRLLQSGGRLVKLKIDARDGKVLGVKGRDIQFRDKH